ncbi:MAG: hypothetical protein FWF85_00875 [Clostridiales bacterium]|nr:hypothetical protein [Clostridiales bacterium]
MDSRRIGCEKSDLAAYVTAYSCEFAYKIDPYVIPDLIRDPLLIPGGSRIKSGMTGRIKEDQLLIFRK